VFEIDPDQYVFAGAFQPVAWVGDADFPSENAS
jgi:hypothetical protein